jgi:dynein light chain Tctex-type 1
MSDNYQDEGELDAKSVTAKADETVAMILGTSFYNGKKVNDWVNSICDSLLKELVAFQKPFKYVITCCILQQNGAGMCTATSQFWDSNKDKIFKVYFEQPKSGISCCVTIYALAVKIDNAAEME